MVKKRRLSILVIACCVVLGISLVFTFTQKEKDDKDSYNVQRERQEILNSLFQEFETQGGSIAGGESPHIFINVQDEDDILKVREYLSENLPYNYVKDYEIEVFSSP